MESVEELREELSTRIFELLRRSLYVLRVDSGSCNGCEIEIFAALVPQYDVERFGIRLVASPRHADALLVTGPVTRQFAPVLKRVYEMVPEPKVVIAVGACGCGGGIWYNSYAVEGGVDRVIPVDVYVPGCPPHPAAILYGVLVALDVLKQKMRWGRYEEPSPGAGRKKPLAVVAAERKPTVISWELYRELDRVARRYLGYLYGSILLREYIEALMRVKSVDELEREARKIVEAHGGDPQVELVIREMNKIVRRRLESTHTVPATAHGM